MARFELCLPHVLAHEGLKSDHPKDPGGRTNQGITNTTFSRWLVSKGRAVRDVFSMAANERDTIYRELYWNAVKADSLPAGLDLVMFDGAVNSGPMQAVKWLQRSLGGNYKGAIDGVIGAQTLRAIQVFGNTRKLIDNVLDRRLAFLQALSTFSVFGRGWTKRVAEVRNTAIAMVSGAAEPTMRDYTIGAGQEKATIGSAKSLPGTTAADATTATGVSNGTLAVALESARGAIEPYAGQSGILTFIVVALALSGLALTLGGFVWRFQTKAKSAKLADALNLSEVNEWAPA